MAADLAVIVAAHNEADRLGATLRALRGAFPHAEMWVADDGSTDATADVAEREGARVVRTGKQLGKGGAATLAAEALLAERDPIVLLADADLANSAANLALLVEAVSDAPQPNAPEADARPADLAIATFARRVGGGFGVAVGASRWAIQRATGRRMEAPMSGQRAMRPGVLRQLLPFAPAFGIETGMTIDALRRNLRVVEVPLDLEHRATGKTLQGFLHRARQARDVRRAYASRRT
jgi:glycosyltransferase involved in cell wall biosynthesis